MTGSESLSPAARAGLAFSGTVTAAISHEMRNIVAALSENAGLLGDFVLAAEQGRRIDPARRAVVNERVARFVGRADELLSCMSRLGHATDHGWKTVDLTEASRDVVTLCGRLIAATGREVHVAGEPMVTVDTSPFFVRVLLWRCVDEALGFEGRQQPVGLAVVATANGAEARIGPAGDPTAWQRSGMPGELERELCTVAGCEMAVDPSTAELVITWDGRCQEPHRARVESGV